MKHDTVVNIAGSINTMAMILLILINLSKNIGIELLDVDINITVFGNIYYL